jgi:hypothetical protein
LNLISTKRATIATVNDDAAIAETTSAEAAVMSAVVLPIAIPTMIAKTEPGITATNIFRLVLEDIPMRIGSRARGHR